MNQFHQRMKGMKNRRRTVTEEKRFKRFITEMQCVDLLRTLIHTHTKPLENIQLWLIHVDVWQKSSQFLKNLFIF